VDRDLRDELRRALSQPDAPLLAGLGRKLERSDDLREAATCYDAAFGLDPSDSGLTDARASLLDRLAVTEHGLAFRYVPAGTFAMGSETGDPDEQPIHTVELGEYWLSDVPISWTDFCALMSWEPPPSGFPVIAEAEAEGGGVHPHFHLAQGNKIRRQYCGPHTDHNPSDYAERPMVAVSWQSAEALGGELSTQTVRYRLPTEAEWEKGARGGLVGAVHPWGDGPPTHDACDFNHFGEFLLRPSRDLPPNGYGLRNMCGGVWEWTRDRYDALFYRESERRDPCSVATSDSDERVLRGGSWSDCAEVCTVSFRMARASRIWSDQAWGGHDTPNVGFRLFRTELGG
jgi:formylglycine-generating enzyme required for sulfatase activity